MLDTSDKNVFVSGYDPAMGTAGFPIDVADTSTILLTFDVTRRAFVIINSGNENVYLKLASPVDLDTYTMRLRHNGMFAMDNYGGLVAAICEPGKTSEVYVTDVH